MYKIKIVFLSKKEDDTTFWSQQWINWNGVDDTNDILEDWFEKEEASLEQDNIDAELQYALIAETVDTTSGKFYCDSCDNHFDNPDGAFCPFCGRQL